jgi:hypothetical protein
MKYDHVLRICEALGIETTINPIHTNTHTHTHTNQYVNKNILLTEQVQKICQI